MIKKDGPWAEVDANGVTVGLNGREPECTEAEGGLVLTFQPGRAASKRQSTTSKAVA
jgi:hypothetical protein